MLQIELRISSLARPECCVTVTGRGYHYGQPFRNVVRDPVTVLVLTHECIRVLGILSCPLVVVPLLGPNAAGLSSVLCQTHEDDNNQIL
jgi:hypothetical protein